MIKDRLTYKTELGVSLDINEECHTTSICWDCDIPPSRCKYFDEAVKKLADYEDLEEQGLLLRLPCREGSIVYKIITQYDNFDDTPYKIVSAVNFTSSIIRELNKTVFLTQSEAEEKLRELEKSNV